MLSFPDAKSFFDGLTAVGNSTDSELATWSNSLGFSTLWDKYTSVLDRFEQLDNPTVSDFMTGDEQKLFTLVEDEGAFRVIPFLTGRSFSSLVNERGLVMINSQLHYFSDKVHILIPSNNPSIVEEVLNNPNRDWLQENIVVTHQEEFYQDVLEKVQTKLVTCPSTGVAHRETIGNQRLIHEMNTYVFSTNWASGLAQYHASLRGILHNERKQGLTWRRTWSDLEENCTRAVGFTAVLFTGTTVIATTTNFIPVRTNLYPEAADVDHIFAAMSTPITSAGLSQSRFFDVGRVQGRRVSDTTTPNLDITVGCNN